MTVFESLIVMLTFGALIVANLSEKENNHPKASQANWVIIFYPNLRVTPLKGYHMFDHPCSSMGGLLLCYDLLYNKYTLLLSTVSLK